MSDDESAKPKGKDKDGEKKKKSPLVLVLLLVAGLVGGVGVSKVMGGGGSAAPVAEPPPEPGEVAIIEAININLAGGHFLRISVGAQLTKKVVLKGEVWAKSEGAKVSDATIDVFSGRKKEDLDTTEGRKEALGELKDRASEATEKEVMAIYLNEYVTQ
jgi:flagellar FliL protein